VKEHEKVYILMKISLKGGIFSPVKISTSELAKYIKCSQQSASRKLIELEQENLIIRRKSIEGTYIMISEKGLSLLYSYYLKFKKIFEKINEVVILRGTAVSGLGEGAYYVSLPFYYKQFKEKLGFEPYPGTFNVKLDSDSIKRKNILNYISGIKISEHYNGKRKYGGAKCFYAIVNDKVKGALILIERTHHGPEIIEIIAPLCIRKVLNIKDGDPVVVKVYLGLY